MREFNSNNLLYSIYDILKQFMRKKIVLLLNIHLLTHDKMRTFHYIKIVFYNNSHINKAKFSSKFQILYHYMETDS